MKDGARFPHRSPEQKHLPGVGNSSQDSGRRVKFKQRETWKFLGEMMPLDKPHSAGCTLAQRYQSTQFECGATTTKVAGLISVRDKTCLKQGVGPRDLEVPSSPTSLAFNWVTMPGVRSLWVALPAASRPPY